MGMFDTYTDGKVEIQLKVGPCDMDIYRIGDEVPISDGIYLGYSGFVAIKKSRLIVVSEKLTDSWGTTYDPVDLIERLSANPLIGVVKALAKKKKKAKKRK